MTQKRVLVIEHQANAGLGQFSERLRERGLEVALAGPDTANAVPGSLDGYDGLIVLGGSMGPTSDDEAPWLPATRRLLSEGVDTGVPTLGVCLGAQLLATAEGGHVRTMPSGPEIGLCAISVAADAEGDPLFEDLAERDAPVMQWHWLEVDALPEAAVALASSPACRNQVFRLGRTAWGVQFHPEALGDTAEDWCEEDREGLAVLGLSEDEVVSQVRGAERELRVLWGGLADRFAAVVAEERVVP